MIALSLAEIAALTGGRLVAPAGVSADTIVDGSVQTDSRLVEPGSIFFALAGETTDGHLFAPAAAEAGAALVIGEHDLSLPIPQVIVADGYQALAALARGVVARVRAAGTLQIVAITGSNGKTTTKNMLRAVLEQHGPTVAPRGSFNNHVGAPVSMLRIDHDTRYLIVEMGASGTGQIQHLMSIVTPDVAVVLKVGLAHAGNFGGVDAIAEEKAAIVRSLPEGAVAVLNADDHRVVAMAQQTKARIAWFGLSDAAGFRAADIDPSATGTDFTLVTAGREFPVHLRVLGEHHVMNALAALDAASALGIDPADAIPAIESVVRAARWRMELLTRPDGVIVINDAYNASPDSTAAALKTLAQVVTPEQRSVAVLGEMAELGDFADEEHDRIGRLVVRLNIRKLVVVGHRARHIHNAAGLEGSWDGESVLVESADQAYDLLNEQLRPGDVVLVKSSNSAGLRFLGDRLGGMAEGTDK
ncbi:UDP-N-acetylmuramoyl-tripeptide--D-alanyl-D-alanine ligase [Diaminobutyricimonas sp. TR449]|uniref:UDP-N-acetylmuramoyl-tripeptide--D-alanyl-D- alanine ligase n=1 Tax=Diaminobutyricimonas sp. TR449 TaxID=2708076 RepID=UPI00141E0B9A|nr:UDP-N-acetylmuramoyl-tripeptide--D-alanyl-D-alanine ligase [Diaminobutyricimonas sp. TR449]